MRPCCSCARLAQQQQRRVSTVQHFRSAQGTVKVNLQSSVVGVVSTRGDRPKQEDAYAVCSLDLPTRELRRSLSDSTNKDAVAWRAGSRPGEREPKTQQVAFLGIYDGHGGDQVSSFLRDRLHVLLESAEAGMVHDVVQKYKQVGGFFRRFKGGILQRLASGDESDVARYGFSLDQKAALAFLQADEAVLDDESIKKAGAVATVALLHSLDTPPAPFFSSSLLALNVAHIGDTRAFLCASADGAAHRLTETHHPESRTESNRLRSVGAGLVTDSFGESRLGGGLANSRGIGDRTFKRLGVTAEPDFTKRVLHGQEWACLILVTDGVSGFMSDQELVDLVRGCKSPTKAAEKIVAFAQEVGSDDNMTCLVVPLLGWGNIGGNDTTEARRQFRLKQNAGGSRARRQ